MEQNSFKAIIASKASKSMTKSNGSQYVLIGCTITEGPLKGLTVAGTRTTINADAVVKEVPEIGSEVTLFHSFLPSTTKPGELVHFFEISTGLNTVDNNTISKLLGINTIPQGQTI